MTLSPICIKKLLLFRALPNRCRCPTCRQGKEQIDSIEHYRLDLWQESAADPFPEKTGKIK
jgi:hypothetical protein